jgi:hypothetical protein
MDALCETLHAFVRTCREEAMKFLSERDVFHTSALQSKKVQYFPTPPRSLTQESNPE